jgi:hypothetical protein
VQIEEAFWDKPALGLFFLISVKACHEMNGISIHAMDISGNAMAGILYMAV